MNLIKMSDEASTDSHVILNEISVTIDNNIKEIQLACVQLYHDRNRELYRLSQRENTLLELQSRVLATLGLVSRLNCELECVTSFVYAEDRRVMLDKVTEVRCCLECLRDAMQQVSAEQLSSVAPCVLICGELAALSEMLLQSVAAVTGLRHRTLHPDLDRCAEKWCQMNNPDGCVLQ